MESLTTAGGAHVYVHNPYGAPTLAPVAVQKEISNQSSDTRAPDNFCDRTNWGQAKPEWQRPNRHPQSQRERRNMNRAQNGRNEHEQPNHYGDTRRGQNNRLSNNKYNDNQCWPQPTVDCMEAIPATAPTGNKQRDRFPKDYKEGAAQWDRPPRKDLPRPQTRPQTATPEHTRPYPRQAADRPRPVCLDYLKGICATKRWKCKYAHPPLKLKQGAVAEAQQALVQGGVGGGEERKVCEVFVLTGFCKFGEGCRDFHPSTEDLAPVCARTITAKMLMADGDGDGIPIPPAAAVAGDGNSSGGGSPGRGTPPPKGREKDQQQGSSPGGSALPAVATMDVIVRKVNGILNRLTPEKFDVLLQQMFELLTVEQSDGTAGVCLQRVLTLLFAKAVAEPINGEIYARLWKSLYGLVGSDEQPILAKQLLDLTKPLIYDVSQIVPLLSNDEEQLQKLHSKRLGNAEFMGQLYLFDLLVVEDIRSTLKHFLVSCHITTGMEEAALNEAEFSVELTCRLLSACGSRLQRDLGKAALDKFVTCMRRAAAEHGPRQQMLVLNTSELFGSHWVSRHNEEKPRTLAEIEAEYTRTHSRATTPPPTKSNRCGTPPVHNAHPYHRHVPAYHSRTPSES